MMMLDERHAAMLMALPPRYADAADDAAMLLSDTPAFHAADAAI